MAIGKDINTERIVFELTYNEKQDIKKRAREAGVTIRQYIFDSISLRIKLEDKNRVKFASQDQ